jgi:hypothetical protein
MYSIAENLRAAAIRHAQARSAPDYPRMDEITKLCKDLARPLVEVEDGNIWEFADKSRLMFMRDKISIVQD